MRIDARQKIWQGMYFELNNLGSLQLICNSTYAGVVSHHDLDIGFQGMEYLSSWIRVIDLNHVHRANSIRPVCGICMLFVMGSFTIRIPR